MSGHRQYLMHILTEAENSISNVISNDSIDNQDDDPLLGCLPRRSSATRTEISNDKNETESVSSTKDTKPVRPLSAYNMFFQLERERILHGDDKVPPKFTSEQIASIINERHHSKEKSQSKRKHSKTHGKIGFTDLARAIAQKWKNLDKESLDLFKTHAEEARKEYQKEMDEWKIIERQNVKKQVEQRFKQLANPNRDSDRPSSCYNPKVSSLAPLSLTAHFFRGSQYLQESNDFEDSPEEANVNISYDFGSSQESSNICDAYDAVNESYNMMNQLNLERQNQVDWFQCQQFPNQDSYTESSYAWDQGYVNFDAYEDCEYQQENFDNPINYPSSYQTDFDFASNQIPDMQQSRCFSTQYWEDTNPVTEGDLDSYNNNNNWVVDYAI